MVEEVSVVVLSGVVLSVRRFIVGRSGSSAGALPVEDGVDAVVVESVPEVVLSEVRRFIVGRSGSSDGVVVLLVVEGVAEPVADGLDGVVDVPELVVSELRRFMVGRSASSPVAPVAVPEEEVAPDLLSAGVGDLVGLLSETVVESPAGFEPKCGLFVSFDAVMTGTFFDGFRAVVVLRGAARGLTLP